MAPTTLDLALCLAVPAFVYAAYTIRRRRGLPYPPGPQGYPLIGNLAFPADPLLWERVYAMSKEYGTSFALAS